MLLQEVMTMSISTLAPALFIQTLILRMAHLMEHLKLHCKRCSLYLFSFALVLVCCVAFCLDAKADSVSKWTATWNLSNHQTVGYSIAPGASVFRGWTLNINGPMKKDKYIILKIPLPCLAIQKMRAIRLLFMRFSPISAGFIGGLKVIVFYYADKDADWVRVYVSYNMYNVTKLTWQLNNAPSSYTEPINLSDIPPTWTLTTHKIF